MTEIVRDFNSVTEQEYRTSKIVIKNGREGIPIGREKKSHPQETSPHESDMLEHQKRKRLSEDHNDSRYPKRMKTDAKEIIINSYSDGTK